MKEKSYFAKAIEYTSMPLDNQKNPVREKEEYAADCDYDFHFTDREDFNGNVEAETAVSDDKLTVSVVERNGNPLVCVSYKGDEHGEVVDDPTHQFNLYYSVYASGGMDELKSLLAC